MARKLKYYSNIDVVDLADKGYCIGKSEEGEVFLIEGVIPGDNVNVSVKRKKKGLKLGIVSSFNKRSAFRQDAFCQHFGICGGCKWQNLIYQKQLAFKEKAVREVLKRIGGVEENKELPIIPAAQTRHFRNKLEYSFSNKRWLTKEDIDSKKEFINRNALGFHRPGLFDKVVDIQNCYLQDEFGNEIRNFVRDFAQNHQLEFFDIRNQEGLLRNLIIRNSTLGEWMVVFSFYRNDPKSIENLLDAIRQQFPQIQSIQYVINSKGNDSILDLDVENFYGPGHIIEVLGDIKFRIGPKSFFQTNSIQANILFNKVVDLAELTGSEVVYDLYSGTGTIALFLAAYAQKVVGIESVLEAVEDARLNCKLNGIDNVYFHYGKVEELLLPKFINANGKADLIVVDPPRAGLHLSIIPVLLNSGAPKIVYVSCNASTQARDILALEKAYECLQYQSVDLFPHSHHVENIALLKRR